MAVDPVEFDLLRRRADELNLYLNEHRNADVCSENVLYIMEKRKLRDRHCNTLLKYATPEQCWKFMSRYQA